MPTETFMKLPEDKKEKIIRAAKKEFSRVPFEETSIKNIVQEAEIARGSFYQYFESKEDLLRYMMEEDKEKLDNYIREKLKETKGDIFEVYINIYDYMIKNIRARENMDFHRKIFESIRACDETSFVLGIPKEEIKEPFKQTDILEQIDKSKLKVENKQDLQIIIKMLFLIIRKALVSNFKYNSPKEAREEYIKMIEYLKKGVSK